MKPMRISWQLLAVVLAWLCGVGQALAQNASVDRGRALYGLHCVACHGVDPKSNSTRQAAGNPQVLGLAIQSEPSMRYLDALLSVRDRQDLTAYIAAEVAAGTPVPVIHAHRSGWYWNPAEAGRGYFFEKRNGNVFMAGFYYDANGRATWFTAQGAMNGNRFSAPMSTFRGGQTLTGEYRAPTPTLAPGGVSVEFSAADRATLDLAGTVVEVVRFPFATGSVLAEPQAGAPESGWWWNPAEGGRGYALEFQGNQLFLIGFMYDAAGNPLWYSSNGAMQSPTTYQGVWAQFADGQALGQPYRAPRLLDPNVGSLGLVFSDARNAVLTLPDGRRLVLVRFDF